MKIRFHFLKSSLIPLIADPYMLSVEHLLLISLLQPGTPLLEIKEKKPYPANEVMDIALKRLECLYSKSVNTFHNFGQHVTSCLVKMSEKQSIIAQKEISDILFHGHSFQCQNNVNYEVFMYQIPRDVIA